MSYPIPKCFASRGQFQEWTLAARRSDPGGSGYCADCTAQYQRQMIDQDRCAYPGTTFRVGSEGGVDGRRPEHERIGYEEGA